MPLRCRCHRALGLTLAAMLAVRLTEAAQGTPPESANAVLARAVEDFERGRIADAVSGFDRVVQLRPDAMPQLWQRGIAQYYAGQFNQCRAQFEAHRTVNPADVENAAWHFLCVARAESADQARAALLPVGHDRRVPMAQIYRMFKGEIHPDAVLAAGRAHREAQFYARLYVGLYYEATGDATRAREHLTIAADERFAAVGGYMHTVARVHVRK